MDVLVVLLRGVGQLTLALLVGGATFLLISGRFGTSRQGWLRGIERYLPTFWAIHLGSGVVALTLRAARVAGETSSGSFLDPGSVEAYVFGTHVGQVAVARIAVAASMAVPLFMLLRGTLQRGRGFGLLCLLMLAGGVAAMGPLAGHAAADATTLWLVPVHMAHLLAMSIWLGGLPFWIGYVLDAIGDADDSALERLRVVLGTFSRMAMACVLVIVGSGTALAWVYIDTEGDLLGTRYGALLCGKVLLLAGVLLIANRMRLRFLPTLANAGGHTRLPWAARWVSLELILATTVAGLGVMMGQTTPAIHDQPVWPFWRRLSLDATWPVPETAIVVSASLVAATLAAVWLLGVRERLALPARALLSAVVPIGVGTALWKLSVPAYPETFRRSTVPYLTVSIAQGMQRFDELCSGCHGPGGLGDGPIAKTLPKPPANLSEPHTALHTAGDMFWWMTHGIPESGMPGFAAQLDEQARWDVINFLRAFSEGFQARTLDPSIVPHGPWLGAPNFYFEDEAGNLRELKDYRERSNVLLVFPPSGEAALERVRQMAAWSPALRRERTEILLISSEVPPLEGMVAIRHDTREIRQTYELLSRTTADRGDGRHLDMRRDHMEFLIDRFGYIRARWIPEESATGWMEPDRLLRELEALNGEPRIRPPPDDHIH